MPPMLVGAQVRGGGPLAAVVERGRELGAAAIQVFTQSPRMWRPSRHSAAAVADFRQAMAAQDEVRQVFCHATYLVNLGTPDEGLLERSRECLADNLRVSSAMGADGLVLHVGSHLGAGMEGCIEQVVTTLGGVLDRADHGDGVPCPVLLENTAGAGGTIGRDFAELAAIIDRVDAGERLGVCLDTQHLWATGIEFSTEAAADAVVDHIAGTVGMERLRCIHLNDSAVALGANRDRHANLGEGTIGTDGLAALLGHPSLQHVAAILEVPGVGDGPTAEQVALGKAVVADGLARRQAQAGSRGAGRARAGRRAAGEDRGGRRPR